MDSSLAAPEKQALNLKARLQSCTGCGADWPTAAPAGTCLYCGAVLVTVIWSALDGRRVTVTPGAAA